MPETKALQFNDSKSTKSVSNERKSVNSSNSSNSNASAFLNQNQRMIFKYPDGTYAYAWKCSKNKAQGDDTWLQYKANSIEQMPSPEELAANLS